MQIVERLHIIGIEGDQGFSEIVMHRDFIKDIDDENDGIECRVDLGQLPDQGVAAEFVRTCEKIYKMDERNQHPVNHDEINGGCYGIYKVIVRPDTEKVRERDNAGRDTGKAKKAPAFFGLLERQITEIKVYNRK